MRTDAARSAVHRRAQAAALVSLRDAVPDETWRDAMIAVGRRLAGSGSVAVRCRWRATTATARLRCLVVAALGARLEGHTLTSADPLVMLKHLAQRVSPMWPSLQQQMEATGCSLPLSRLSSASC